MAREPALRVRRHAHGAYAAAAAARDQTPIGGAATGATRGATARGGAR